MCLNDYYLYSYAFQKCPPTVLLGVFPHNMVSTSVWNLSHIQVQYRLYYGCNAAMWALINSSIIVPGWCHYPLSPLLTALYIINYATPCRQHAGSIGICNIITETENKTIAWSACRSNRWALQEKGRQRAPTKISALCFTWIIHL